MGYSHDKVISAFFNSTKPKYLKGSRVFANRDTDRLYSHGTHFTLAKRRIDGNMLYPGAVWYLLNGDKYSVSTSQHQGITYAVARNQPRVSYSAIWEAGLNVETCVLVDFIQDASGMAHKGDSSFDTFKKLMPIGAEYHERKDKKTGEVIYKHYHRVGSCVLKKDGTDEYYLCSMDEGSYFVSLLPHPVTTVGEAFESLKPEIIKAAIAQGEEEEVRRQGEWFAINAKRIPLFTMPKLKEKDWLRSTPLPHDAEGSLHIPTRVYFTADGMILAKGILRHRRENRWSGGLIPTGEHKNLYIGDEPHLMFRNTARGNWSSGGKVD